MNEKIMNEKKIYECCICKNTFYKYPSGHTLSQQIGHICTSCAQKIKKKNIKFSCCDICWCIYSSHYSYQSIV